MSGFQTELVVRPYPSTAQCDGRNWVLVEDLVFDSAVLGKIIVPAGFTSDFASVPAVLWAKIPPYGTYGPAAVLHDFAYWSQSCTRAQADNLLMEAMLDCNVDERTRLLIYEAVHVFGQHAWDSDAKAKAAGLPHVSR